MEKNKENPTQQQMSRDRAEIAQELERIREALWDGRHGQDHLTPCEIDDTFITLIERIKV